MTELKTVKERTAGEGQESPVKPAGRAPSVSDAMPEEVAKQEETLLKTEFDQQYV